MTAIGEILGGPKIVEALTAEDGKAAFHQAPLPYSYGGLAPVLDEECVKWLYEVQHAAHVKRLNKAVRSLDIEGLSLEDILENVSAYPREVRESGGAHWNFTFFWQVMTDLKEDQEISSELNNALTHCFGSVEAFKAEFAKKGAEHEGSGWVWLLKTPERDLKIVTTQDYDNPLMDVSGVEGAPVLVCSLRDQTYHSSFHSNREEFLRKFFAIVNWSRMHKLLIGEAH